MTQPFEYSREKALSQSSLKLLEYNPKLFYEREYLWLIGQAEKPRDRMTDAMKLGSLVDCLVLTPELIDTNFAVANIEPPTGQMLTFVNCLMDNCGGDLSMSYTIPQTCEMCYAVAGFKRDSLAKVMERFAIEGKPYIDMLASVGDRTMITAEMMEQATTITLQLRGHGFIGSFITPSRSREVMTQVPLACCSDEYPFGLKGLLDVVIVDHESGAIQVADLKTTSESFFPNAMVSRRYDLQAAIYTHLVRLWKESKPALKDYTILPFLFIVASTNGGVHDIWELNSDVLNSATFGGLNIFGRRTKGWLELMDDLRWHMENDKWLHTKEVYSNGGVRRLKDYYSPTVKVLGQP